MNPFARHRAAIALAAVAALSLSACASGEAGAGGASGGGADGALKVVATTTQLTDFAEQVGGDDIDLTGLMTAGASAHHFDPSPADLLALGQADVLIVNGGGLELFVESAVEASGFNGEVIDASDGIDLHEAETITHEGDSGHEGHDDEHDHGEQSHDGPDHEAHGADGHDHGAVNPHFWTSPRFAADMVREVEAGLVRADPDRADAYGERADATITQLTALDEWATAQFERVPAEDRIMVSGHDSLRYYLHDYGIEFAGSILPSFEDNAEPNAADLDALIATIREREIPAIFVESSMSPKQAETIARESGARVVDAETLYADSVGPEGSGADTYIGATVHNTRVILEAWGATPDDLPAELHEASESVTQ